MRITFLFLHLIVILPIFSQNIASNEADSLLKESFQKFVELKFIESAELADQALQHSTLKNYSKGKVISNIYIAKVLVEVGLNMEALKYIQDIYKESYFAKDVIYHVESHRLKGRIYGSQQLYTLAKKEFNRQLSQSEKIEDPKKRELSKLWAYQNIEHLYVIQGVNDSIEKYQDLQDKHLLNFEEHEVYYNISSLYASKGRLYMNKSRYDEAEAQLKQAIGMLEKYNLPYRYSTLQTLGDLEAARGNNEKAISYYNDALDNSSSLDVASSSRDLHKTLADFLLHNDTLVDKAKEHLKEYRLLNDSLEKHNNMVADAVFKTIIKDSDEQLAQKGKSFRNIVISIILISFIIAVFLIARIRKNRKMLLQKSQKLISKAEEIELLEEEIENNIFNDIIELAKKNSPEFLPLFGEGYPEFIDAMKLFDPTIRSSELYFCALAYLNFSTKDIANYTFVTTRAVQVRKNRLRKKHNIPSEVDFNEWFRSLVN